MTVLVTGGLGFLGRPLVELLCAAGREVIVATRHPETARAAGAGLPEGVRLLTADGSEPGALVEEVARGDFEQVFHLAALARMGDAERDPGLAMRLNRDWSGELAAAAASSATALVHVSTDLVFGARPPLGSAGFGPEEPSAPLGRYGESKAAGEAAVRAACPVALVVRLPLLFGESRGRGLGAGDGLLSALERGESPRLFTDELRSPLDVDAAARGLFVLAAKGATGTWHLGGRSLSRYELGRSLVRAAGGDPDRLVATTRAELGLDLLRASDARLDSSATRAASPELAALLDLGSAPHFPQS